LRHIHMTPEDACRYGVRDRSVVRVRIAGDRELVLGDVLVRVSPSFALAMHIDTDEATAASVKTGAQGYIEGIQSEGGHYAHHPEPAIRIATTTRRCSAASETVNAHTHSHSPTRLLKSGRGVIRDWSRPDPGPGAFRAHRWQRGVQDARPRL